MAGTFPYTVQTRFEDVIRNGEPAKVWYACGLYSNGHFANQETGATEAEAIERLHAKEAADEARRAEYRRNNPAKRRGR